MIDLSLIIERVEAFDGDEVERASINDWLHDNVMPEPKVVQPPNYVCRVDYVNQLAQAAMPLWWISSGQCSLGPHASCGPDGRSHKAAGVPYPEQFDSGFHVDFQHAAPEACARLAALLRALQASKRGEG